MMRYPVQFSQDGKWWGADVPDLGGAGLATQGASLEEARRMAADLIVGALVSRLRHGEPLDQPGPLPEGGDWEWVTLPLRMETALRIREGRQRNALTMQQAADAIGVPLGTYQRWEDPWKCNATLETLERVARAFGKRVEVAFV